MLLVFVLDMNELLVLHDAITQIDTEVPDKENQGSTKVEKQTLKLNITAHELEEPRQLNSEELLGLV